MGKKILCGESVPVRAPETSAHNYNRMQVAKGKFFTGLLLDDGAGKAAQSLCLCEFKL